jgi:MFS family permease
LEVLQVDIDLSVLKNIERENEIPFKELVEIIEAAVLAAYHVDRFDRRHAMLFVYGGLLVSTLLGALAPTFAWLVVARVVAGIFGGIAGALVHTIAGDLVPDARREIGRASCRERVYCTV